MRHELYCTSNTFLGLLNSLKLKVVGFSLRDLQSFEYVGLLVPRYRKWYPTRELKDFLRLNEAESPSSNITQGGAARELEGLEAALAEYSNYYLTERFSHHPFLTREIWKTLAEDTKESSREADASLRIVRKDGSPAEFKGAHEIYFSSWQVLQVVEANEVGVRYNFSWDSLDAQAIKNFAAGKLPLDLKWTCSLFSGRDLAIFKSHARILDAATYLSETRSREVNAIGYRRPGRFLLNETETKRLSDRESECADFVRDKFTVTEDAIVEISKCLIERWDNWNRLDRPPIASAYRSQVACLFGLGRAICGWDFNQFKSKVDHGVDRFSVLDRMWPNWIRNRREVLEKTLCGNIRNGWPASYFEMAENFANLENIPSMSFLHWKLAHLEDHAFDGNEFANEGMATELQGLAVVVEQVIREIMGARAHDKTQFVECAKLLWNFGEEFSSVRNRKAITQIVRSGMRSISLSDFAAKLEPYESGTLSERVFADLMMTQFIRGAVHFALPRLDQIKMEKLASLLLRVPYHFYKKVQASPEQI